VIIEYDIPEIVEYAHGFPGHWVNVMLMGNHPGNYTVHSITTSYVRYVEAALQTYRSGRSHTYEYWKESEDVKISAYNMAITDFETCITNMHRAARCIKALFSRPDVPENLKALISPKPHFCTARVADQLRMVRDMIQHVEGMVNDGTIPENTPFYLRAYGPEVPVEGQPGQTILTLNRLEVGDVKINFKDLCRWLREMGECAERIATFTRD
jgi:hypothetical protein